MLSYNIFCFLKSIIMYKRNCSIKVKIKYEIFHQKREGSYPSFLGPNMYSLSLLHFSVSYKSYVEAMPTSICQRETCKALTHFPELTRLMGFKGIFPMLAPLHRDTVTFLLNQKKNNVIETERNHIFCSEKERHKFQTDVNSIRQLVLAIKSY